MLVSLKLTPITTLDLTQTGSDLPIGGCPLIAIHPVGQTIALGKTVVFECQATGAAPLTYNWLHNGREMTSFRNHMKLTFVVNSHSKGEYSCRVENEFGFKKSDSAMLTVGKNYNQGQGFVRHISSKLASIQL